MTEQEINFHIYEKQTNKKLFGGKHWSKLAEWKKNFSASKKKKKKRSTVV